MQTAEAMRRDRKPEWMQVIGLKDDLGKLLYFLGSDYGEGSLSSLSLHFDRRLYISLVQGTSRTLFLISLDILTDDLELYFCIRGQWDVVGVRTISSHLPMLNRARAIILPCSMP